MGLFSKIIGGYIGFTFFGGPLGALAGVALADLLDGDDSPKRRPSLSSQEESQHIFFVATFSLLGKLAKVDGRVSREEIAVVDRFMNQDLALDDRSREVAQRIFNEAKRSTDDFRDYAAQFAGHFHTKPQMLQGMVELLLRVAAADGRVDAKEEHFVKEVARIFGLSDSMYQHMSGQYVNTTSRPYDVLGLSAQASNDEIKKRYKKLVLEHHPDRAVSDGMPEEFKRMAEKKFREIQEAYEAIQKERGI